MKTVDLEYRSDGFFTRFYANTPEGENVWREMARFDQSGIACVLNVHAKKVISQMRKAGYTVQKAAKPKESIDQILAQLEA